MFSLELNVFRVIVQEIHQNSKKMAAFIVSIKTFLVKMTLKLF